MPDPTAPEPAPGSDLRLRRYEPRDLDAVYDIAVRTGDAGGDARPHLRDHRLVGELWAAPYVTLEPEHAHVLDGGTGRAVGYVLGTADVTAFEARCEQVWWPPLRRRYPLSDERTLDALLVSLLHHRPPPTPALDERFPSELHIDLLPEAQGRGWGRRMIEAVCDSFRRAGSPGVQLGTSTRNTRAIAFYRHVGFEEQPSAPDAAAITFTRTLGDASQPPR